VIETLTEPGRVKLTWYVPLVSSAAVERRTADGAWTRLASLAPDGDHRIVYEDRTVVAGGTYRYRLAFGAGVDARNEGETSVAVPGAPQLALSRAVWNSGGNALAVSFSLPRRGSATVEMFDAAGRRLARHALEGLEPGAHQLDLPAHGALESGVYFVRVSQSGDAVGGRFTIVR